MDPPAFTLDLMTLNVWSGELDDVAQDILDAEADAVGLQEITPSELAELRSLLGADWSFVQEDRDNTHGILSKHPILERIGMTDDLRGGIGATIELRKGLRMHLFSTHLMYTPYGPYQLAVDKMSVEDVVESELSARMPGLNELLDMATPQIASDEATFLVGDFNAPSHLDYEPEMPWPTSLAPQEAGLIDSYAELHPENEKKWAGEFSIDDPGITWTQLPSEEPNGCYDRIDFVYYSSGDATAQTSHTINVKSSDHRAVLTRFELKEPPRTEKASNPLPNPNAVNVKRHPLLSWTPGKNAIVERLYLGSGNAHTLIAELDDSRFIPDLLAADTTYSFRVDTLTEDGIVTGDTWTFTTRSGGGLAPNKQEYAQGEIISVDFNGGDTTHDWIGLYARNAAYGAGNGAITWSYLNDTDTAPSSVVPDGTISFVAPTEAGTYVLRFFDDDGYTVEDELSVLVE